MKENQTDTERLKNTSRDPATTGTSRDRFEAQPGLADEDTPPWSPPESQPEPRPVEPILNTPTPQ